MYKHLKFSKYFLKFYFRSTFHSGQTRRPAPASQYGVPISSQVPTYLPTYLLTYLPTDLPIYLPTYLPTNLPTFFSGYECSKLCGSNLLLLEAKLQVLKTLWRNRNVNIYFTLNHPLYLHLLYCTVLWLAHRTSYVFKNLKELFYF